MREKPKLKLKKFYFHPITVFIALTFLVILLSGILSLLQMQIQSLMQKKMLSFQQCLSVLSKAEK